MMTCHERQDRETNRAIWIVVTILLLLIAALIFLTVSAVGQLPPFPGAPAPKPIVQSPKGAAMTASPGAPMAIVQPGPTQIVLTLNNTNPFTVLACTAPGKAWFTLTNGAGSVTIPLAWLNTFTNPYTAWTVTLAWNASTDATVTGYNIYWGLTNRLFTASQDCGNVT